MNANHQLRAPFFSNKTATALLLLKFTHELILHFQREYLKSFTHNHTQAGFPVF